MLSALCAIFATTTKEKEKERSLLYYQLRAQVFKALQLLLQHAPNLKLFLEQKQLGSALFDLAIGATSADLPNADGPTDLIERRLAALEMSLAGVSSSAAAAADAAAVGESATTPRAITPPYGILSLFLILFSHPLFLYL